MFPVRDILIFAVVAGLLAAAFLAAWPWARRHGRFAVAAVPPTVAFVAWHLPLNATDATGFNVDAPVIPLSWADAGSGVLAFTASALALGLVTERDEPSGRVVGAAAISGLAAIVVDLFVL